MTAHVDPAAEEADAFRAIVDRKIEIMHCCFY